MRTFSRIIIVSTALCTLLLHSQPVAANYRSSDSKVRQQTNPYSRIPCPSGYHYNCKMFCISKEKCILDD